MAALPPFVKKTVRILIIALIGICVGLGFFYSGWLENWEAKTWDSRVRWLAKPGPNTDDIRVVLLDQESLDWAKEVNGLPWPWPRELYSVLLNYFKRAQAKAVAFDVLFTEPSKYGVEDDQALSWAIKDYGRFTIALFLGNNTGSDRAWPENIPRPKTKVTGLKYWQDSKSGKKINYLRALMPVPELISAAAVPANVQMAADPDNRYRRVQPFSIFDNTFLPFLGLGAYLAGNPKATVVLSPDKITINNKTIKLDKDGSAILRYRGKSRTHKTFSAAAVIQSELRLQAGETPTIGNIEIFKDKYIFFGFSAPGLLDLRPTPFKGVYSGVEINVTTLDNFLSEDFMEPFPMDWTIILLVALALASSAAATLMVSPSSGVIVGVFFLTIPIFLSFGVYNSGYWLQLLLLETGAFTSVALALVVNYSTEGRQKRFLKSAFKQYLSPIFIEQLIEHPERLKLGGERKELSIFFSDLQGFTSMSEKLDPEELTELLNRYLTAMTEIIQEEGGTVDKYEGDAIIAFWNAPLTLENHAERTVRAALRCQERLAEMRPSIKEQIDKDLLMRVGMNTGLAVVGNMGSVDRFDYTMLGDAVNLAARLEGANKEFGTYTMISENTKKLLGPDFFVRELGRVVVVGRSEAVTIFEPMFKEEYDARAAEIEIFEKALHSYYHAQFDDALSLFESIKEKDPAAGSYFQKCMTYIEDPPEDWDGIWVMTTK